MNKNGEKLKMSAVIKDAKPLPANIRFLRKRDKISQEELAAKLDISRSNIAAYESKGVEPRLRIILEMARLFDVNVRTFISQDLTTCSDSIPSFNAAIAADLKTHTVDISDSEALQKLTTKTIQIRKVVDGFKAYQEIIKSRKDDGVDIGSLPYDAASFLELLDQLVSHNESIISSVTSAEIA